LGKVIQEKQYSAFINSSIDMNSEEAGFYMLEVKYEGETFRYKIIKK
jgi:hypothetical protein